MTLNVEGAGKHYAEATLKTVVGDEAEAQKMLDLFGVENYKTAVSTDNLRNALGSDIEVISHVFKTASYDSVVIGQTEATTGIEEIVVGPADTIEAEDNVKTREEIKKLEEELDALKKEIEQIESDITKAKAKLEEKKKELEEKKKELEEKQQELDRANEILKAEQAKLDDINKNIQAKNKEKEDTEELIQQKQKELITKAEEAQSDAVKKAKADYDEQTDGDWNSFLMKKLGALGVNTTIASEITQLTNKLTGINTNLAALNNQYAAQQTVTSAAIQNVNTAQGQVNTINNEITLISNDIADIEAGITAKETAKAEKQTAYDAKLEELESSKVLVIVKDPSATEGIVPGGNESVKTQDDIKNMIPEKEFALVEKYGVDLGEKLEDGSPRYIFAEGKDKKYHIYDMGNGKRGVTLARLYEPKKGFDVVPKGSGYLNKFQEAGEGKGKTVYYFCGDGVKELQGCYNTSSPLSFDLNGDGIKTSDEIVEFDIDGDGVLDKINNSADAVLVFDKDGDGISGEDGSECFGDNTDIDGDGVKDGYKDGFEALKAFARDKGLINDADDMVLDKNDIKYLEENFGFGLKTEGYNSETKSLADLGITEINLASTNATTLEDNFDGNGNQLMKQEGATFVQNGETKDYADIWHKKLESNTEASDVLANGKNIFKTYNAYDDFLANFDPDAYTVSDIEINTSFNFLDINADAPDSKKDDDKKDEKENHEQ